MLTSSEGFKTYSSLVYKFKISNNGVVSVVGEGGQFVGHGILYGIVVTCKERKYDKYEQPDHEKGQLVGGVRAPKSGRRRDHRLGALRVIGGWLVGKC